MSDVNRVRTAVYRAVNTVNELLPPQQALPAEDETVLVGPDAMLDSMGFVNFIVALEEELERELRRTFAVSDLMAVQGQRSDTAFTIGDIIDAVSGRGD